MTSYNRDIEVFPLLKTLLREVTGEEPYQSPTDMGVNMAGYCISNDAAGGRGGGGVRRGRGVVGCRRPLLT